ncbi:S24/S26 family peptidase [Caldanaerobius fijiensis]
MKVKVKGNSMLPALCNSDIVIIETTDCYIVVELIREKLIVHLVIEINNDVVLMRGDNNASENNKV